MTSFACPVFLAAPPRLKYPAFLSNFTLPLFRSHLAPGQLFYKGGWFLLRFFLFLVFSFPWLRPEFCPFCPPLALAFSFFCTNPTPCGSEGFNFTSPPPPPFCARVFASFRSYNPRNTTNTPHPSDRLRQIRNFARRFLPFTVFCFSLFFFFCLPQLAQSNFPPVLSLGPPLSHGPVFTQERCFLHGGKSNSGVFFFVSPIDRTFPVIVNS